jgi:hypothetical protein
VAHMTIGSHPTGAARRLLRGDGDGVLYRVMCLIVPPSAVYADEPLAHARR